MKIFQSIKRHPNVSAIITIFAAALLFFAFTQGKLFQMVTYLTAMLAAGLITDWLTAKFGAENPEFKTKAPAKELKWILASQIIALILSFIRFQWFSNWQQTGALVKLPLMGLMILFGLPTVLLIVFLKWNYSLKDLGFRFNRIWLALPVILIIGATTWFFAPEKIHFVEMHEQMGLLSMVLTGFLFAAVPEELARFFLQTRLGKVIKNDAAGWLIASLVWAFLHFPNFYAQSGDLTSALWGVLSITPIGLLWGLMTYRTRSILPSVAVHGTNLWGLQNF